MQAELLFALQKEVFKHGRYLQSPVPCTLQLRHCYFKQLNPPSKHHKLHDRRPKKNRDKLHALDCVWNVMVHAQKPDFVFRRNGPSPFKSAGASVQSTTGSRSVRISGSKAGYTTFRGSVKGTGHPLHSSVSPSPPLLSVTVCHHVSTGLLTHQNLLTT
jgi:hypothetical protein